MPPKSNVPIRIGGSRARSGCRTCKQRHVKCDEAHPICVKCQRGNRSCIYDPIPPLAQRSSAHHSRSDDLAVIGNTQYLEHSAWSSLNNSIGPYAPYRSVEMSAIQHFTSELGKELAGSFSNAVWCDILPRVAQHESSIWHGIVAVSMLDMDHRRNYSFFKQATSSPAIMHCNKAIREFHILLEEPDEALRKDVILLCCLLFAVFQCLQGYVSSALHQISGGMKLLIEWEGGGQFSDQVSLGSYLNRTMLQSIFLFLDSQAIQLGATNFRPFFSGPALDDRFHITHPATLEQAHILLTQIFHRISHWENWSTPATACGNRPSEEWMLMEKFRIQTQLEEWDIAFHPVLALHQANPTSLLTLVQRKVLQVFFGKACDGDSEMEWDKYIPVFEETVQYAEAYAQSTSEDFWSNPAGIGHESASTPRLRPVSTIAADIVLPLFLITTRCRNASIRRRALKILKACNRREGVWDSKVCSAMAEKIIQIEENAATEDGRIPESARVITLDIHIREEQAADISLIFRDADNPRNLVSLNESIAW